jgi:hypothetical protein
MLNYQKSLSQNNIFCIGQTIRNYHKNEKLILTSSVNFMNRLNSMKFIKFKTALKKIYKIVENLIYPFSWTNPNMNI